MNGKQPVLVLAAGHGKRMGGPKAFTMHAGRTFLQRILARCGESGSTVTLVTDPAFRARLEGELPGLPGPAPRLVNADGSHPMLDSVRAGLAAGGFDTGFWLWPVDAPFISPAGWAGAVEAVAADPKPVRKLRVNGITGHPIWFPGWSVPEILGGDWPDGLLGFLAAHAGRVAVLPLDGEELRDFNTPEQLRDAPRD